MQWIPRFEYDTGPTILTLTRPQRPWVAEDVTIGGSRTAASGYPAAYVVRREEILRVRLRIDHSEWASLKAMVEFGQAHPNTVTFYPDKDDLYTSFECYLETPKAGEAFEQDRQRFPNALEVTLRLRLVSGGPWNLDYWG